MLGCNAELRLSVQRCSGIEALSFCACPLLLISGEGHTVTRVVVLRRRGLTTWLRES